MIGCRCAPHASGSNRCTFCHTEIQVQAPLSSAVALIANIAKAAGDRSGGSPPPHVLCDRWLEANGYACEASRKRERERRADELDALIERLREERGAL